MATTISGIKREQERIHAFCSIVGRKSSLLLLAAVAAVAAIARALSGKRRQGAYALKQACNPKERQLIGEYNDAGIPSTAVGWSVATATSGTIVGVVGFGLALPVLLPFAILSTVAEALRHCIGLDTYVTEAEEGDDDQITLVMPGMCTFAFWQVGMTHYLCENFDTRGCKMAGVSSGAICSAMFLKLEKAASAGTRSTAAERVREQAHAIYALLEKRLEPVATWPCAFVCRLGGVLDALVDDILLEDFADDAEIVRIGNRIRIGFRRLAGGAVPALVPDTVNSFSNATDLITSMSVSGHVGIMVRPTFLAFFARKNAYCSDGVNPFSFYCFIDYWLQRRRGIQERTAPSYCQNGLDVIYALWNCGAMRVLLPRKGKHLWISPAVGGKLDVRNSMRVSDWWAAEQWRLGYAHAKELDAMGYWNDLPRWKDAANSGASHESRLETPLGEEIQLTKITEQ